MTIHFPYKLSTLKHLIGVALVAMSLTSSAQSWQEYFNAAIDNAQSGNMESAISNFDKAVDYQEMPKGAKAQAYYFRGAAHGALGHIEEAIASMSLALQLDTNYADAYLQRGLLYNNGNESTMNPIAAATDLEVATRLLPNNLEAWMGKGIALFNSKRPKEAIKAFDKVLDMSKNEVEAIKLRGIAYRQLGKFDLALKDLNSLVRVQSTNSEAYFERGVLYALMDNYEYAIRDYTQAIVYDQSNYNAHFNRGIAYSNIDNHQAAIADFSKVIQNDPTDKEAYFNRALELIFSGKEEDGCYDMKKAADLGYTLAVKNRIMFCGN